MTNEEIKNKIFELEENELSETIRKAVRANS